MIYDEKKEVLKIKTIEDEVTEKVYKDYCKA